MLTFLPLSEIAELEKLEGSELNKAKEILAYELTELIHGREEAEKAQVTARALFSSKATDENMPTTEITEADLTGNEAGVLGLLCKAGLTASNGEARRLVVQGGISVNDVKVTDPKKTVSREELSAGIVIKKGKKIFHKVILR